MHGAVKTDPDISSRPLREQFEKLIQQPLASVAKSIGGLGPVVVIDALDECENDSHIKLIVHLIAQVQSIQGCGPRFFVTSRPEVPIRLGFGSISADAHKDIILHQISSQVIKHDISAFLVTELTKIREKYNASLAPDDDSQIATYWPSKANLDALVTMTVPLFIFAATVCRFVAEQDWGWDPEAKLEQVLRYKTQRTLSQMEKPIYRCSID